MVSYAGHEQPRSNARNENPDPAILHSDFILVEATRPPRRIELGRERMLLCRLYLGLIRSLNDDYGTSFGTHSDSATFRAIGIYVFLRTVMCSPARATNIAEALKI